MWVTDLLHSVFILILAHRSKSNGFCTTFGHSAFGLSRNLRQRFWILPNQWRCYDEDVLSGDFCPFWCVSSRSRHDFRDWEFQNIRTDGKLMHWCEKVVIGLRFPMNIALVPLKSRWSTEVVRVGCLPCPWDFTGSVRISNLPGIFRNPKREKWEIGGWEPCGMSIDWFFFTKSETCCTRHEIITLIPTLGSDFPSFDWFWWISLNRASKNVLIQLATDVLRLSTPQSKS